MATEVSKEEIENTGVVVRVQTKTEEIEGTDLEKTTKLISIDLNKECTGDNFIFEINLSGIDKPDIRRGMRLDIRSEVQNKKNNG